MSNAVVILGAGASADFGVPTLRSVFKDVYAQFYLRSDPALQQKLEQFFWQPRGHTLQTSDQSLTIEEMLTVKGGVKPDQRGGAKIDHCDGGKG